MAARLLLQGIGETALKSDQRATPRRVAETWTADIVSGYRADPARILGKTIPSSGHDMVVVRDIPFTSVCVHHLLPFQGTAHVAYVPGGRLVGLSKITRAVDALASALRPLGAACTMDAEHLCMTLRGARKRGARVVTFAGTGVFRSSPGLRAEFLRLAGRGTSSRPRK